MKEDSCNFVVVGTFLSIGPVRTGCVIGVQVFCVKSGTAA